MGLNENIPEKVTKKALREAADEYERAHLVWMQSCKRRDQGLKEDAGDRLYQLVRGVLAYGFYTYRDAVVDSWAENLTSPDSNDFD